MNKNCVLVQAHKSIPYIFNLAKLNPNVNFYIHFDKKSDINIISGGGGETPENIIILSDRVNVQWGGISQVEATICLLLEALKNPENMFFHLVSGECLFIKDFDEIQMANNQPELFMDVRFSTEFTYRVRFDCIFSDSKYLKSLIGKCFVKFNKIVDKIFPLNKNEKLYSAYGSSWFSINRQGLEMLCPYIHKEMPFFKYKVCPDEHFFQYIVYKYNLMEFVKENKRYLVWCGNHPKYLELEEILNVRSKSNDIWVVRKVTCDVALNYLTN
ncbi:conjugal transfer protein [Glaesserella parasuis]|nr:conjugal transfer protein [Glaesserella parasuis]